MRVWRSVTVEGGGVGSIAKTASVMHNGHPSPSSRELAFFRRVLTSSAPPGQGATRPGHAAGVCGPCRWLRRVKPAKNNQRAVSVEGYALGCGVGKQICELGVVPESVFVGGFGYCGAHFSVCVRSEPFGKQ